MTHHTLLLNGLILGMLVVASLIGALLKWRVGFDTPHAVIDTTTCIRHTSHDRDAPSP